MAKKLIFIVLLFGSIVFLWTRQPLALAAPFLHDDATTTPAPEEEAVAEATPAPAEETAAEAATVGEPTVADLVARLDALQAQVDELIEHLAADHQGANVNEVTTAVYLLDTAGLHDLDVRLNEEQVIEASDAGRVARVSRLLASVDWPEPLATEIMTLTTALHDLTTALTDDNLDAAAPLATLVHEVQHDFSHAVEHWLEETSAPPSGAGQTFRVTSAVYLLDNAGLHDLDVRLNEEQVIDPSDPGQVARVSSLLSSVDWPEPLATEIMTLTTALTDLTTALTNDDLATAAPLATLVHEAQHDFSHAAEHWLGDMLGTHGADEGHAEEATSEEGADHTVEEGEGEGDEQKESSGG